MNDQPSERDPQPDRPQSFDFGGVFQGLGKIVERLNRLAQEIEQAGGEVRREVQQSDNDGNPLKIEYHLRVNTDMAGARRTPSRQARKPVAPQKPPVEPKVREPLVDLFEEGDEIVVIVELPGVETETLTIELHGDLLQISGHGLHRYASEVILPVAIDPASLRSRYHNGILEVRLTRQES